MKSYSECNSLVSLDSTSCKLSLYDFHRLSGSNSETLTKVNYNQNSDLKLKALEAIASRLQEINSCENYIITSTNLLISQVCSLSSETLIKMQDQKSKCTKILKLLAASISDEQEKCIELFSNAFLLYKKISFTDINELESWFKQDFFRENKISDSTCCPFRRIFS